MNQYAEWTVLGKLVAKLQQKLLKGLVHIVGLRIALYGVFL